MKLLPFVIGLLIGFSLTFTGSMGADPEPIIQTVTKIQTIPVIQVVNSTEPTEMTITAYSNYEESTGKQPGNEGFGITFSGEKTHVGTCAVDQRYIPLHTSLYIQGLGYCEALDTGSAVKGYHVDYWMANVSDAMKFGRQTRKVWILNDY